MPQQQSVTPTPTDATDLPKARSARLALEATSAGTLWWGRQCPTTHGIIGVGICLWPIRGNDSFVPGRANIAFSLASSGQVLDTLNTTRQSGFGAVPATCSRSSTRLIDTAIIFDQSRRRPMGVCSTRGMHAICRTTALEWLVTTTPACRCGADRLMGD
jgi:hypothetical protein